MWEAEKKLMVKLSLVDQSVFCDIDKTIVYPVPGGWGIQVATFIELRKVKKQLVKEALAAAWCTAAPKTMVKKYMPGVSGELWKASGTRNSISIFVKWDSKKEL